ncbi:MAG: DUF4411 family protein [Acidaminococcaceae bacterium]|nr:DUF4411 family protein [Acidaminococcaceae bacterium]
MSSDLGTKYLVDANILISACRKFYAFDIAPVFWKLIASHLGVDLFILDKVQAELAGEDSLAQWLDKQYARVPACLISTNDSSIVSSYQEIMQYVSKCGYYNPVGQQSWQDYTAADPWLVATAMAEGYTLITFEKPNNNLSTNRKSKSIKIPDVANYFGVRCIDLFEYMRRQKICFEK